VSVLAYPARTSPMMFTALRHVPFPVTITSAQRFHAKAEALAGIGLRVKQMRSGNDAARRAGGPIRVKVHGSVLHAM
jgi:hypothetical protein